MLHLVDIILKPSLLYRFPLFLFFTVLLLLFILSLTKWCRLSWSSHILEFADYLPPYLTCSIHCIFCKLVIRSLFLISQSTSEVSGMFFLHPIPRQCLGCLFLIFLGLILEIQGQSAWCILFKAPSSFSSRFYQLISNHCLDPLLQWGCRCMILILSVFLN